jgi:hypothetical protein
MYSLHRAGYVAILWVASMMPGPVDAQALCCSSIAGPVDVVRAEEMEAQAYEELRDVKRIGKAATLLRKAAALRPVGDPVAVTDLTVAGQLFYYVGNLRTARTTSLNAAEAAIRIGDVLTAANTLIDVTHIAYVLRDASTALTSFERAELLARSPHLKPNERMQLMQRLNPMKVMVFKGTE